MDISKRMELIIKGKQLLELSIKRRQLMELSIKRKPLLEKIDTIMEGLSSMIHDLDNKQSLDYAQEYMIIEYFNTVEAIVRNIPYEEEIHNIASEEEKMQHLRNITNLIHTCKKLLERIDNQHDIKKCIEFGIIGLEQQYECTNIPKLEESSLKLSLIIVNSYSNKIRSILSRT